LRFSLVFSGFHARAKEDQKLQLNESSRLKEKAMEAIKLAFETLIIGLFALPWLWVMIDLVNPDLFNASGFSRLIAFIPSEFRQPAIGLALFSGVYLLGSMVTPVASEFWNDPDMLGKYLPTETKIQAWTYGQMGDPTPIPGLVVPADLELVNFRGAHADPDEIREIERVRNVVHDEFQREESTLLLGGTDKCARLNRLHEQLTVLRGAAFSAFALMMLCGFAWCVRSRESSNVTVGQPPLWQSALWQVVRRSAVFVLSAGIILVARKQFWSDVRHPQVGDIPIAELVLFLFGAFGVCVAVWGTRSRMRFHGLTFVVAVCLTALCYAGYGCLETAYDQEVFNTYQALQPATIGNTAPVARPAMVASIGE
jgi:hypothetical protein